MLSILTILTALTLGTPSVDLETLDGARFAGPLHALSAENAQIETLEGQKLIPTERLMSVMFPQSDKTPSARDLRKGKDVTLLLDEITLIDGSQIFAADYRVKGETAHLFLMANEPTTITIPTRDISTVRFSGESKNLDSDKINKAWTQFSEKSTHSDRLVVAKSGSLDYHAGTLGDVTDTRIVFSLDGDPLKVKRQKVFGVTYYHPAGRELPKSLGRLTTCNTSCTFVSVTMDGDRFKLKTPTGLDLSFSIEQVRRIDFAEGKIAYLSDMPPESTAWTPYLATKNTTNANKAEARATLFGPKFNKSFQAGPLILDGEHYPKGLAIHSRSVITYRLDKKYGRLTATVGIADRVRPRGHVQLIIEADGRVLLDREISGTEEAIPLDLNLAQADRLTITVDFGNQTDIADRLILGDAKVME